MDYLQVAPTKLLQTWTAERVKATKRPRQDSNLRGTDSKPRAVVWSVVAQTGEPSSGEVSHSPGCDPVWPSGVLYCMVTLTNALTKLPRHGLAADARKLRPKVESVAWVGRWKFLKGWKTARRSSCHPS